MQPLDPTIKSTWFTPTQTAITKPNAKLLQDNLADDATLADQLKTWQLEIKSDSTATVQEPLKKAFALWMKDAGIPTSIQTILAKDPTAKAPSYITNYLALDPKDPTSVAAYKSQLTKEFGGLKNSKGESLINTDLIDAVASGSADFNDLGNQIITAVQAATNKSLGSSASQFSDITNSPTYKSLLNDPSKLTDSYNTSVAKLTKNADTGTWEVGGSGDALTGAASSPIGPNGEYIYTGGIGQLSTDGTIDPSKMTKMVDSYDTQKGVWSLPSINKDTNLFEAGTSPYGNLLANSLNNFASKGDYYSPTYVNSLASKQPAAMSSEGIAALKGEFTDPGTSKDLLNLANSAGMNYDTANAPGGITADSKLSPTLLKAYQLPTTPNTSSAGTQTTGQAKPGVPNLTGARSTAPVTALPTTTPGLLTGQTITTKEQADAAKAIADKKLQDDQKKLADENAEKIKLNSDWYKAGYKSADDYSKGMALSYSSGADYYNYLKNLTLVPKTDTLPGGTKTDTLPGGTKTDTLPGGTKTGTLPGITGLNTPLYHKDTDSWLTFSDQAKAKDILAQLDALEPVKKLAETGEVNIDPSTEAGRANIAAGNSPTSWNASWEKSPNNPAFIGSPFYDPNRAKIFSDKRILNDQLNAIRTQTDQTGTVYNWLPNYGIWQPQNQTAPVTNQGNDVARDQGSKQYARDVQAAMEAGLPIPAVPDFNNYTPTAEVQKLIDQVLHTGEQTPKNQGIAAGTSNFTTPENMNTNAGGIPTVLPAQQPAQQPAQVQQQPIQAVGGALPNTWEYANAQAKSQRMATEDAAGQQRLAAIMAQKGLPYP